MVNQKNANSRKAERFWDAPTLWFKPFGAAQVAGIRASVPAGVDERLLRFIARSVPTK